MFMLFIRERLIYPIRVVNFLMKICFIKKIKPPYYQSALDNFFHIGFLKIKIILIDGCKKYTLLLSAFHMCISCLCFEILLVIIVNLC